MLRSAARLDRRVRAEARALVREARTALHRKDNLRERAGKLASTTEHVEAGLAGNDLARVRHWLPLLDALVDDIVRPKGKSLFRDYLEPIGSAVLIALALRALLLAAFEIPSSSMYPTVKINDYIFINKLVYGIQIPFTAKKLVQWHKPERGEVIVFIQPCSPDRDYIKRVIATDGQSVEVRCHVVYVDDAPIDGKLIQAGGCQYDDQNEVTGKWSTRTCSEYAEQVNGHDYDTYHEADRPERDQARAADPSLTVADSNDFPRLNGIRLPPSCTRQPDGSAFAAPNQLTGQVIETRNGAGPCDLQLKYIVPPGHVFVMGDNRANSRDSRYFGSVPIENIRGKALLIWLSYRNWDPVHWGGMRWKRMGSFIE